MLISIASAKDSENIFQSFKLSSNVFQNLNLISTVKRKDTKGVKNYTSQSYKNSKYKVLVEIIEPVDSIYALSLLKLYSRGLIGTYQNRKSPYTGESQTSIPCSKQNIPLVYPVSYFNSEANIMFLNSTDRDVLGVCEDSLIKQKTIVFIGYNPSLKSFIYIRAFMPNSSYNEIMREDFVKQFNNGISY